MRWRRRRARPAAGRRSCSGAICGVANGPVGVDVTAADRDRMLREARDWAAVAANVVRGAARPATMASTVVRACAAERIGTGVAAGASAELALAAARAGAAYVTVPVGRAGGVDGYDMIRKLVALFRTYEVATQVIAAAIRIPTEIIDAAVAGAHAASAPGEVLRQLDDESTRRADGRALGAMRIRQHVNPLKSDLLDIADVPRVEAPRRARAGGRAGRRGGTLPDRPGARGHGVGVRRRRDPARAGRGGQRGLRGGRTDQRAQRVREHVGRHGRACSPTAASAGSS